MRKHLQQKNASQNENENEIEPFVMWQSLRSSTFLKVLLSSNGRCSTSKCQTQLVTRRHGAMHRSGLGKRRGSCFCCYVSSMVLRRPTLLTGFVYMNQTRLQCRTLLNHDVSFCRSATSVLYLRLTRGHMWNTEQGAARSTAQ